MDKRRKLGTQSRLVLGKVFKSNAERITETFKAYKRLYRLEEIMHEERVGRGLFDYCRKRSFFVVGAVYSLREGVFLLRWFGEKLGWELPGSSIKLSVNENVQDAVMRVIDREIPGIEIGELEPIAMITNRFEFGKQAVEHRGLAFMGRSRNMDNKAIEEMEEVKGRFMSESEQSMFRFANQRVFEIAMGKISRQPFEPPEEEVTSSQKYESRYRIHRKTVGKVLGGGTSKRIERRIMQAVGQVENRTFLDVSCGDSELIFAFARGGAKLCVGNDVSWSIVQSLVKRARKDNYENVIFTNHNVAALPFRKVFDCVLCKNTLHHMRNQNELLLLLENLRRVCKHKIVLVEIENPREGTLRAKLWNLYYREFLGDSGNSFFAAKDAECVLGDYFKGNDIEFDRIGTIKGSYAVCVVIVGK